MLFDAILLIFYVLLYNLYLCLNIFLHLQKQLGFYFCFEYSISRLSPVFYFHYSLSFLCVSSKKNIYYYQHCAVLPPGEIAKYFSLTLKVRNRQYTPPGPHTRRMSSKVMKAFGEAPLVYCFEHLFRQCNEYAVEIVFPIKYVMKGITEKHRKVGSISLVIKALLLIHFCGYSGPNK